MVDITKTLAIRRSDDWHVHLRDGSMPETLAQGFARGVRVAARLYPAHAVASSAHGVSAPRPVCAKQSVRCR